MGQQAFTDDAGDSRLPDLPDVVAVILVLASGDVAVFSFDPSLSTHKVIQDILDDLPNLISRRGGA